MQTAEGSYSEMNVCACEEEERVTGEEVEVLLLQVSSLEEAANVCTHVHSLFVTAGNSCFLHQQHGEVNVLRRCSLLVYSDFTATPPL